MTTKPEANDGRNDITKIHAAEADARREIEARVCDKVDVTSGFTATTRMFGDDDFDDNGDYVGDDPVYITVRLEAKTANPEPMTKALRNAAEDEGFEVTEEGERGYHVAAIDRSGTFNKPAKKIEGEPDGYKVRVKARKRVDLIGDDCDRCNGTGEIMVGEKIVHTSEGSRFKPAYEPCPECSR